MRMKLHIGNKKAGYVKSVMLLSALLFCVCSSAQKRGKNLVPNPSFEDHKNKSNVIKNAIPWQGSGTVDYYLRPDKTDTSRFKGAHTGTCYAGLRFQIKYKEYIYVKLIEPLQKEKTYYFKMFVRLGLSTVTLKQLGVYFSKDEFTKDMTFDEKGILDSTFNKGISSTHGWIPINGEYIAQGGEKFIIIGNFNTKTKDDFVMLNKWDVFELKEAYYYLDDISVRKKITAQDTSSAAKIAVKKEVYILPDTFDTGQAIEIKNLEFENGSAELKKNSDKILDAVVLALNENPFMEVQIIGRNSDQGNEAANKKLSKARAKTVYDYILLQGVINPMTFKGMGAAQRDANNGAGENKTKTSSVEFVIIKQ